jgi:hypothetical protein
MAAPRAIRVSIPLLPSVLVIREPNHLRCGGIADLTSRMVAFDTRVKAEQISIRASYSNAKRRRAYDDTSWRS